MDEIFISYLFSPGIDGLTGRVTRRRNDISEPTFSRNYFIFQKSISNDVLFVDVVSMASIPRLTSR